MTKKRSSEIFDVKMKFSNDFLREKFPIKRSFEDLAHEFFSVPPKLGAKSPPMCARVSELELNQLFTQHYTFASSLSPSLPLSLCFCLSACLSVCLPLR